MMTENLKPEPGRGLSSPCPEVSTSYGPTLEHLESCGECQEAFPDAWVKLRRAKLAAQGRLREALDVPDPPEPRKGVSGAITEYLKRDPRPPKTYGRRWRRK